MVSAKGVKQPGMGSAGVHQAGQPHLGNAAQSLIKRVLEQSENVRMIDRNKSIYRIINNFPSVFGHALGYNEKLKSTFWWTKLQ